MALAPATVCPHCSAPGQAAFFCTTCSRYTPDEAGLVEKVTYNRRFWGTYILEATPKLTQVAHNTLDDKSDFSGSPSVSDGQLIFRSDKFLYCVQAKE